MEKQAAILAELEQMREGAAALMRAKLEAAAGQIRDLATRVASDLGVVVPPDLEALFPIASVSERLASLVPPPPPPVPTVELETLRRLDAGRAQSEVLQELLRQIGPWCGPRAIVVLRDDAVQGWSGAGFAEGNPPRAWRGRAADSPALARAAAGTPVLVRPSADAVLSGWFPASERRLLVVPMSLRGKVVGLLLALESETGLNAPLIQQLTYTVGLMLETLTGRAVVPTPALMEPVDLVAAPAPSTFEAEAPTPALEAAPPPAVVEEAAPPVEVAPVAAPEVQPVETDASATMQLKVPIPPIAPAAAARAPEDERKHEEARRFARLLVSEVRLYNEQAVQDGQARPRHLPPPQGGHRPLPGDVRAARVRRGPVREQLLLRRAGAHPRGRRRRPRSGCSRALLRALPGLLLALAGGCRAAAPPGLPQAFLVKGDAAARAKAFMRVAVQGREAERARAALLWGLFACDARAPHAALTAFRLARPRGGMAHLAARRLEEALEASGSPAVLWQTAARAPWVSADDGTHLRLHGAEALSLRGEGADALALLPGSEGLRREDQAQRLLVVARAGGAGAAAAERRLAVEFPQLVAGGDERALVRVAATFTPAERAVNAQAWLEAGEPQAALRAAARAGGAGFLIAARAALRLHRSSIALAWAERGGERCGACLVERAEAERQIAWSAPLGERRRPFERMLQRRRRSGHRPLPPARATRFGAATRCWRRRRSSNSAASHRPPAT